jgi:hypothetical protein
MKVHERKNKKAKRKFLAPIKCINGDLIKKTKTNKLGA